MVNEVTQYKCLECGAFLEYDIRGGDMGEYACPACGARWDRLEYFEFADGRKQYEKKGTTKPKQEGKVMAKRGRKPKIKNVAAKEKAACIGCGGMMSLDKNGKCYKCRTIPKDGHAKLGPDDMRIPVPKGLWTATAPAQVDATLANAIFDEVPETKVTAPSKRFGISFDIEIAISNVRVGG